MHRTSGWTGAWMWIAAPILAAFFSLGAAADSATVSYQGVLRDATLSPVPDGGYPMEFSIYDADTDGTAVWGPEEYASVALTNGMFSVYLGSIEPLGTLFADHAMLWLEISADTGSGMETYAPRVPLASVPYAQHALHAATADHAGSAADADALGGQPPSAYAEAGHAHAGADITSGTVSTDRLNVGPASNQVARGNHAHALNDLSDVSAGGPGNGQALAWSQATSQWEPAGGYAIIRDVKPAGTRGGTATAGWNDRVLNDLDTNIPGLNLVSNQFTLPAGRYRIHASAPAYRVNRHKMALYNVTATTYQFVGSNEYCNSSNGLSHTRSVLEGHLNLTAPTTFLVRHYVQSTWGDLHGFGVETSASGLDEVYTIVTIRKY